MPRGANRLLDSELVKSFIDWEARDASALRPKGCLPGPFQVRIHVRMPTLLGFGSEAIGTDAGPGYDLSPPYPCHDYMHGAGRYGLQCLRNLSSYPTAAC